MTEPITTSLEPELLERLRGYLLESVVVVNAEGRITASLNPPGGLLGRGDGVGRHIFEYCPAMDLPRSLEIATEALQSEPGWSSTWSTRLNDADGRVHDIEVFIENRKDDDHIAGFVVRLREYPINPNNNDPLFGTKLGQELESLAGAVPLPIVFIGSDGHVYYLNDAAVQLAGPLAERLERDGLVGLAAPFDRPTVARAIEKLLSSPGEEIITFSQDGTDQILEARIHGRGRDDQVLALVVTLVDITERHEQETELRRQATRDSLTGALNRREFEGAITERLLASPTSVGVLYVDLNEFKALNDTFGHDAGDQFLIDLAVALRDLSCPDGIVGRLGGDEFVIACSPENLETLAPSVRDAVSLLSRASGTSVSASVGVASGIEGDCPRELLRRADRAMYSDKRSERPTT